MLTNASLVYLRFKRFLVVVANPLIFFVSVWSHVIRVNNDSPCTGFLSEFLADLQFHFMVTLFNPIKRMRPVSEIYYLVVSPDSGFTSVRSSLNWLIGISIEAIVGGIVQSKPSSVSSHT